MWQLISLVVGAVQLGFALSQVTTNDTLPNTFPHAYQGIPNENANFQDSKAWQDCKPLYSLHQAVFLDTLLLDFLVNGTLTNVSFPLPRSFAGSIPVNRPSHPNNTLFFWGFEKSNGSLTRAANDNDTECVNAFRNQ